MQNILTRSRRKDTSFIDGMGRVWEWKFVPKDMHQSEWSIHYNVGLALSKFKMQLGKQVVHRRDVILVMGSDEKDLLRLSTAATFAVQGWPWLREIDLWKSFVNVDLRFLEGLDKWWLD